MTEPFTPDEQQLLIDAIRQAELATSGEIRVHIESRCPDNDPIKRAIAVFGQLGMHQTQDKNGVLFYLAIDDRKFAILGDKGIDAVVPPNFWDTTKDLLRQQFAAGQYISGLQQAISQAGQQLKQFFPRADDDVNELPDDISFS